VASALLVLLGCERRESRPATHDTMATPAAGTAAAPGASLASQERLDSTDACRRAVSDQLRDLRADTLSARFSFDRYPARADNGCGLVSVKLL
jgi:hypothetical protein